MGSSRPESCAMTDRERFNLAETRVRLMLRAGGQCEICGKPIGTTTLQLAHRIPQTKVYLRMYGKKVIHHDRNLKAVCGLECNSKALAHGLEIQRIANEIHELQGGE